MERIRTVIASDRGKAYLGSRLQRELGESGNFEVFLSREKIARVRGEIKPKQPDLVLVAASLRTDEEIKELRGFVEKVRKHLPQTKIVIHAPLLSYSQREEVLQAGANGWIDDRQGYELLGQTLQEILSRESQKT